MDALSVNQVFKDSTVFLTGATGFLGKGILEKILRCLEIKKIILLVRDRKGDTSVQRLEKLLESPAFDTLKKEYPHSLEKIELITGDLLEPRLGISDKDHEMLLNETNFVFHNAATTRFDAYIFQAIKINLRSTRDLLIMAKSMPHLKAFVQISTAYANCIRSDIAETIYDTKLSPNSVISLTETLDDKILMGLEKVLLDKWPNTYTFTKALAESTVKELGKNLPACVVRPSAVISANKEPFPGYIDGYAALTMGTISTGMGLSRAWNGNKFRDFDLIPSDYVVNTIIAAAWKVASQKNDSNGIAVYNVVTGADNPITLQIYFQKLVEQLKNYVPSKVVFYPGRPYPFLIENYYCFQIANFVLHKIPAYVMDLMADLVGAETPRLIPVYEKMDKMFTVIDLFLKTGWKFDTDNTQKLYRSLSEKDKEIFYFNVNEIDWDYTLGMFALGCRTQILGDSMDTLPDAVKRFHKLKIYHHTIVSVIFLFIFWLLYIIFFA